MVTFYFGSKEYQELKKELNIRAFIDIIPNFAVRFIANKLGQNYFKLSKNKVLKYTSNKNYW